jgi:hypothetical protein
MLVTILLFFAYTWGLGFTITSFLKKPNNFLEKHLMNIGLGLGTFPILAIFLNFIRVPLDWKIFLFLSMAFPIYILFKSIKENKCKIPTFQIKKSDITILIVVLLFLGSFFMYTKGAFGYPYLENEDPWGHAVGAKYVSLEKTAYDPPVTKKGNTFDVVLSYMDLYPPAYDVFLGVLHQTNDSVNWTLKFFNALIVSLGIIFFYFFAKQFIGNRNKALFATFILAMIPCYLSHFIWAHSLVVTLFFPLMYSFERVKIDKKWAIVGGIIFASIWVTQNLSQPLKLSTLLLMYIIIGSIVNRKFMKEVTLASLIGGVISLMWWGVMILKYGFSKFVSYYGVSSVSTVTSSGSVTAGTNIFIRIFDIIPRLFSGGGTGTRSYLLRDFLIATKTNMINNPIGVGLFISLLALISLVYILVKYKSNIVKKENFWIIVTIFWLFYTFWGVNGQTFGISVARGPFRVWMLMAIAIALICAEGFWFLLKLGKRFGIPAIIIILFITGGVWITSGNQKYKHNTNPSWPTSGSFSGGQPSEPFEYANWFNTLEPNTNVFMYSPRDKITIGLDGFSCEWCQDVLSFRENITSNSAEELYSFLLKNQYKYIILGRMDYKYLTTDITNEELAEKHNEIINYNKFNVVHNVENMMVVLEII